MAPETPLLQDLAVVMGVAALTSVLFKRLQLPPLFGFLAAGVLVGPQSPLVPLVREEGSLRTLADLGVVLLLFGLGLAFDFRQLRRVGGAAFVVMITQGLLLLWLGFELGSLIGWDTLDSLFLGATLSISSTTVTVKILRDLGRLDAESSRIILGVLILQDIAAVLILVLLAGYSLTGGLALAQVGRVLAEIVLFLLATILLGLLLVPRFVDHVARHYGDELLVLTILGLVFGLAILSFRAGFHVGLGAFLMGAVVAEAKQRDRIAELLRPLTDVFTALFFVSIGTLLDPGLALLYWKPVVAVALLVLVGKFVSGSVATFFVGYAPAAAVGVGAGLAQIGEFSFVIVALGQEAAVTSDFLFPVVVGASAVTSLAASFAIRSSDAIARGLGRLAPAPLRTYVHLYTSWMSSVRTRGSPARLARRTAARRSALVTVTVIVTVLGAAWILQGPGRRFLADQGLGEPSNILTYWGLVLALLLPLLYRFFQSVNRWLATWEPTAEARRGGVRTVIQYSFYLLGAILLGLPVLAATAPLLRTPVLAIFWTLMVGSAAVILWASIMQLHARIQDNVQALLDDQHVPVRAPQVVRDLMTVEFPWDLRVETLDLAPRAWASGKRVGELELRSATGASLILVERGDFREETPGPDTVLLPGDRLTLIGAPDQLASARAVLTRTAPAGQPRPELRLGRLYVSEASPLDGVKLSDAALPTRSGLQVVAIVRDDKAIPNPGANERLHRGDIVLVLGPQEKIAEASALVGPGPPPPRGAPPPA